MKAYRGNRIIAPPILNFGVNGSGHSHATVALPRTENLTPHFAVSKCCNVNPHKKKTKKLSKTDS